MNPGDLYILMLCAIRYGLGRATYITAELADLYRRYRGDLSPGARRKIEGEIAKEIADYESAGKFLGHECDHLMWKLLVEECKGEGTKL